MEEGGKADNLATVSSDLTEKSAAIDPRLTECPVCLDQLRHPKSLPCLHTFCEECLDIYITQKPDTLTNSFPCPICRLETVPVDPKEERGNWAKQFPTNNLIVEMSKMCSRESQVYECDPCKKRNVRNIAAKVWWKEYNRFLCDACLDKLRDVIDDDHTLVEVTSGQKFLSSTSPTCTYCPKHKKETDLYCEDHQSVCCSTCIAVAHRRCEVVTTLSEHGDKVRSSTQIQDMRSELQEVAVNMESLAKHIKRQTQNLGDGRDVVMEQMTDLRQRFETHLNKLQEDITDELDTTYKEEKKKLDDMLNKCERMYMGIKTTQALSESDVIQDDDMQMVSFLHRGCLEIRSCKNIMPQVVQALTSVEISLDYEDALFMDDATPILGRLHITRTRRGFLFKQLCHAEAKEVGKLCIKTASDQKRCQVTGLLYLSNGHIILADGGNNKVKLFQENGELLDELPLQGQPWDLCMVAKNTVAVTMQSKQLISKIRMKSSKLKLYRNADIKTGKPCHGITYTDGQYVLTAALASEIYCLTKDDLALHKLTSYPYYLANDSISNDVIGSVYTSTVDDTAVFRLSPDGVITEITKVGLLKGGNGVDVDGEGNVYVCGRISNNVVQISRDGTVRELVNSEDLQQPYTLSIYGSKLVLSNAASDTSNHITIYELF
ncbi:uncharacterized protein LOC117335632 [Pecten maximus]|uniref:uncharacterized protein LOC117335632 n=1 Tax=Pecten maximus TaxID=6579 RepID=UPI001458A6A1|nr:uncharacterized protein LOC117335632 [Pecten maximus]